MRDRTVILVSHHVQLCSPGAKYIVALDNGRLVFEGDRDKFQVSGVIGKLVQTTDADDAKDDVVENIEKAVLPNPKESDPNSQSSSTIAPETSDLKVEKKAPRKLVEEERRAVGRIGRDIWVTYILACGGGWYWTIFIASLLIAAISPVIENGWLRCLVPNQLSEFNC